jgi:thiol-disulfide isomerase/thioredoxin
MSKELKPKDFSRVMPHKPQNIDIPTAVLFKSKHCGWCKKMEPEWDEVAEQVGFMNIYDFCIDNHTTHWNKIENSLETKIEGFPAVMFYDPSERVVLHSGYCSSEDMIKKMIKFVNQ